MRVWTAPEGETSSFEAWMIKPCGRHPPPSVATVNNPRSPGTPRATPRTHLARILDSDQLLAHGPSLTAPDRQLLQHLDRLVGVHEPVRVERREAGGRPARVFGRRKRVDRGGGAFEGEDEGVGRERVERGVEFVEEGEGKGGADLWKEKVEKWGEVRVRGLCRGRRTTRPSARRAPGDQGA